LQLDLPFLRAPAAPPRADVEFVRVRRARKYILRVRPDGTLRVTIPRGGSRRDAETFLDRHRAWVEAERLRVAARHAPVEWHVGDCIAVRGQPSEIREEQPGRSRMIVVGDQRVRVEPGTVDVRRAVEKALRHLAARELVPRLHELARQHQLTVKRATVRNQRSRWGSCSTSGVIALNFRLIQMPPWVSDYVLLHELMHLRQQDHSRRYWKLVESVCPEFRAAERWLREDGRALF
jgi:predicted metal-dependent hydrolase